MWPGLVIKACFTDPLWWWVLPSFTEKRGLAAVTAKWFLLLAVCLSAEALLSWQWEAFGFHHMMSHTSPVLWGNAIFYLGISLLAGAVYFTLHSFRSEKQKRELMETQLRTELGFLHAQLNPHFLFNTLNNLFSMAQRSRQEELATAISMLSGLMRYMIYESSAERVPLQMEIDHLRDFIGLARMRYTAAEVQVELKTEGDISKASIAPMVLLPFVENAFKHGVQIEESAQIHIGIAADLRQVTFTCSNQKRSAPSVEEGSSGIGLANVKRRLALLYPATHELEIKEIGDVFEVKLILAHDLPYNRR